jgi:hypothetical protein
VIRNPCLHGQRNPLSGRDSKHTAADVIHDSFFTECKLREKHSAISLWDEVKALADKEGKTPVGCLCSLRIEFDFLFADYTYKE